MLNHQKIIKLQLYKARSLLKRNQLLSSHKLKPQRLNKNHNSTDPQEKKVSMVNIEVEEAAEVAVVVSEETEVAVEAIEVAEVATKEIDNTTMMVNSDKKVVIENSEVKEVVTEVAAVEVEMVQDNTDQRLQLVPALKVEMKELFTE